MTVGRFLSAVVIACAIVWGVPMVASASSPARVSCPRCWRPPVDETFHIQFTGALDTSVDAHVYDVDGFDTPARQVRAIVRAGHVPVCYISGGTWERWRPDRARFPTSVLGAADAGWTGERWLDIRRTDVLVPIMRARMRMCRGKGFRAVDVDNLEGYTNVTGFPLSAADQLRYNRLLANVAHSLRLSIALKNDGPQVRSLVRWFDFAIVEQCVDYGECAPYRRFVRARKPVFLLEYNLAPSRFCPTATAYGFFAQRKHRHLDAWRAVCD